MRCSLTSAWVFVALLLSYGPVLGAKEMWKPEPRILNNLVTELLAVEELPAKPVQEWSFTNPRDGWVFVACTVPMDPYRRPTWTITISIDPEDMLFTLGGDSGKATREAMRFLSAGEHKLRITSHAHLSPGDAGPDILPISRLVVRAVPVLVFWSPLDVWSTGGYGVYDRDFLRKDVLPNTNVIVGGAGPSGEPERKWWRERGGQWFLWRNIPDVARRSNPDALRPMTADYAYDWWANSAGFNDPYLDGSTGDEFGDARPPNDLDYIPYTEAIQRLANNPSFQGRSVLGAWCSGHHPDANAEPVRQFLRTFFGLGNKMCWEIYYGPRATEAEAGESIRDPGWHRSLRSLLNDWETVSPGCVNNNVIAMLGIFSAPPLSLDVNPQVDFRVYMDMQMNYLANSPDAMGLCGLGTYQSRLADEEVLRWSGRLFRHYAIEGKKSMLSDDYGFTYALNYIQNGDFDDGLEGWTVAEAEPGSIKASSAKGLGAMFRWESPPRGDCYLQLDRSANNPNMVSQTIRNLQPGKAYSLRLVVADHSIVTQGKADRRELAFSINLPNTIRVQSKCFVSTVRGGKGWYNYHRLVFRAQASTAKLVLSDWADQQNPGGPIGQQLLINFISIRPYLEEQRRWCSVVARSPSHSLTSAPTSTGRLATSFCTWRRPPRPIAIAMTSTCPMNSETE